MCVFIVVESAHLFGIAFILLFTYGLLQMGYGCETTFDPLRASVVIKRRPFFRTPVILTEVSFDDIAAIAMMQQVKREGVRYRSDVVRSGLVLLRQTGEVTQIPGTSGYEAQQVSALLTGGGWRVPALDEPISSRVWTGLWDDIRWQLETFAKGNARSVIQRLEPLPSDAMA